MPFDRHRLSQSTMWCWIVLCSFGASITHLKAQSIIDTVSFNKMDLKLATTHSVVVIGEGHDIKGTYATQLYIIKQLASVNFKNIFIEGGNAEAHLLNRYLETGDTTFLAFTRASIKNPSYRQFITSIHLYKLKVKFISYDFERPGSVNVLLKEWFKGRKIGRIDYGELTKRMDSLALIDINSLADVELRGIKFKTFLDSIKADYLSNTKRYNEQLGANAILFNDIINNPVFANFNNNKNFFVHRDRFFVKKMISFDKVGSLTESIIIVGRGHVITPDKFIPNLMDHFSNYRFINFIFQYHNCINEDKGNIVVDDEPYFSKRSDPDEKRSIVTFKKSKKQIVPTKYRLKYLTIWTMLYNQI